MAKVICISNKGYERLPLTIGKVYDSERFYIPFSPARYDDPSGTFYNIISDNGEKITVSEPSVRELNIDEKRDLKLNDIL